MRLSEILFHHVRTESGEDLGRVHDVRLERDGRSRAGAGQWKVAGMAVGSRGFVTHLGLTGSRRRVPVQSLPVVPWSTVVRIEEDAVIVADGTKPES